jgi:hypothetical protein
MNIQIDRNHQPQSSLNRSMQFMEFTDFGYRENAMMVGDYLFVGRAGFYLDILLLFVVFG